MANPDDSDVADILGLPQNVFNASQAGAPLMVGGGGVGALGSAAGDDPMFGQGAVTAAPTVKSIQDDDLRGNAFLDDDFDNDSNYDLDEAREKTQAVLVRRYLSAKHRLYAILEGRPLTDTDQRLAYATNGVVLLAIFVTCVVFCIESYPYYHTRGGVQSGGNPLFWIETGCILVFIFEAVLRVWCTPRPHLKNIFFFIDVASIVGYFIETIVELAVGGSGVGALAVVRALRLFRVMRVFKLSRYSKSLQLVLVVVKTSAGGLTILLVPLLLAIMLFATILYFLEQIGQEWNPVRRRWITEDGREAPFQSIPDAIWFCMTTVTTVGYGDVVPITIPGQMVAVVLQFIGVLTLSFPNIVLGSNLQFAFRKYHQKRARAYLGRKFRIVRTMLQFIQLAKEKAKETRAIKMEQMERESSVEVERLSASDSESVTETTSIAESNMILEIASERELHRKERKEEASKKKKRKINYILTAADFDAVRKDDLEHITADNIRHWKYNDVSCITILQRMLEGFSGVASADDLYYSFQLESEALPMRDLALAAVYLHHAGYLTAFAFKQYSTKMLLSLTNEAVSELLLYPEEGAVECQRGADFARMLWRQTTGSNVNFTLQPLHSTYPRWSGKEKYVDNTSDSLDLKAQFAERNDNAAKTQQQQLLSIQGSTRNLLSPIASFLDVTSLSGRDRAITPHTQPLGFGLGPELTSNGGGGLSLEDAKLQMRLMLVMQREELQRVKAELAQQQEEEGHPEMKQ